MARRGRGRLSSIELLPEEAQPHVVWAYEELGNHDRHQQDILEEFNERLAGVGAGPISKSAFSRHSIKVAQIQRRHKEARQITVAMMERLEPGQTDDLTIMAAETIKMLVLELLQNEGAIEPKGAMELARALQAAVNAQKGSMERKRATLAALEQGVDEALERVADETGMGAERIAEIRRGVLGLRE